MKIRYNTKIIANADQRFKDKTVTIGKDPRINSRTKSGPKLQLPKLKFLDLVKAIYVLALIGVGILSVIK